MSKTQKLPPRSQVKPADSWDLSSLFDNDDQWEQEFRKWERTIPRYESFRGTLGNGPAALARCLRFDSRVERAGERLGTYAFLKTSENLADSRYQRMLGRYQHASTQAAELASFIRPEILSLPAAKLRRYLAATALRPYRLMLQRLVRYKPHTLGQGEEKLLAMQSEMAGAAERMFDQLTDSDLKFGMIRNEKGQSVELSHATFSVFLHSSQRNVRRAAFQQYYAQFQAHENSLAAALAGSVQKDVYYAKARGYPSALEASLFHDNVPVAVYDSLVDAVHAKLPAVHGYFDLRRRKMRLRDIHHYDTYVPILSEQQARHTWNQAVDVVLAALEPLGDEYCRVLADGLSGRWSDRYPNQGKSSGAFSAGSYDGWPYILMNYQPDVLEHVFTLAHEASHSMHSHFSAKHQPFEYYHYTTFVAEVASTFGEQLLSRYLMGKAKTRAEWAFLVNRQIDAIRGTIIRQTMFAEFEKITHALAASGEPLTVDCLKTEYGKLLDLYFGPDFVIDDQLRLECLRIPHFYSAFYVYKYATGMSAAIALAERVLSGGQQELDDYLSFLKGGSSKWPLDLLKDAGVDMTSPKPVETALSHFERLVEELDELL
jgi:oligoendopeptidase F